MIFLIYHIVRLYFADTVNNSQGAEYDRDDPGSGLRNGEKQAKQGENAAENDNEYKNAVPGAVDLRSRNCVHIPVHICVRDVGALYNVPDAECGSVVNSILD